MNSLTQKIVVGVRERGWDTYKSFKNEILSIAESKDFIVEILNAKGIQFTDASALLLYVPELWKDFNLSDWQYIIRNVNRPTKYRLYMDYDPCFEDIRFLYNWIGIDSIDLYKNDSELSSENRANLDKVFPAFVGDTTRESGNYKEDFEDGTFGDIKYFKEMKQRLIDEGAKPSPRGDL